MSYKFCNRDIPLDPMVSEFMIRVADGQNNPTIAAEMGLRPSTCSTYLNALYERYLIDAQESHARVTLAVMVAMGVVGHGSIVSDDLADATLPKGDKQAWLAAGRLLTATRNRLQSGLPS